MAEGAFAAELRKLFVHVLRMYMRMRGRDMVGALLLLARRKASEQAVSLRAKVATLAHTTHTTLTQRSSVADAGGNAGAELLQPVDADDDAEMAALSLEFLAYLDAHAGDGTYAESDLDCAEDDSA
jgi:hypothetical protein